MNDYVYFCNSAKSNKPPIATDFPPMRRMGNVIDNETKWHDMARHFTRSCTWHLGLAVRTQST